MPLYISQGHTGDNSIFFHIEGTDSNGQACAKHLLSIYSTRAQINASLPDTVDIVDEAASYSDPSSNTVVDLFAAPYQDFRSTTNTSFASALDVVNYINTLVTSHQNKVGEFVGVASHTTGVTTIPVNVPFNHTIDAPGGVAYFWNETSFPPGLTLSAFDRRKIVGTPTQVGSYSINVEVRNQAGILSTTVLLDVV